ncbi:Pyridine nucleotide-disulfide oxidoreductase-like protein 3 [Elsinoe fawcettii]|nr:Pyridine nucleotide-disulfide oxidoreductase-like protein 3 [Elsinoe fawcettii]
MAAKYRTKSVRFEDVPGQLPQAKVSDDVNLSKLAEETVTRLTELIEDDFTKDAVWRDLLSFTEHFRSFSSAGTILEVYKKLSSSKKPTDFAPLSEYHGVTRLSDSISWVDIGFSFRTFTPLQAENAGVISLIPSSSHPSGWKIWMLRTWLEQFSGRAHPDELQPATRRDSLSPDHTDQETTMPKPLDVIIIGAGQSGLSLAGRCSALGLDYIVLERNPEIGQNWTSRYDSLRWHTSKEYGNLPFDRTFLPEDDYMLTTKQIGSGFKRWVDRFSINVQTSTTVTSARWNTTTSTWTITSTTPSGIQTHLTTSLVLACGAYASKPISPSWPNPHLYTGTTLHSATYRSPAPFSGKKALVIGTANTAHDIATDLLPLCTTVTMLQRSPTFVFPAEWLHAAQDKSYNLSVPVAHADRTAVTYPNKIMREMTNYSVHAAIDANPDRFDALERAGFLLERKGDIYDNLYRRFGGHYVDIGTSAQIARGEIGMVNGAVESWTERGIRLKDRREVQADVVVFCTGFEHDFRELARGIIGEEAEGVDDYFGIDQEGEVRGAFRWAGRE